MSYNYQKNNVNLADAIALYEEEKAFLAAQAPQDTVPAPVILLDEDASVWHQYLQNMDADIALHLSEKDSCDDDSDITPDVSSIRFYGKNMKAATRRQRTKRHNSRMQQTAKVIIDNYACRSTEDMLNFTFCKSRGGRPVKGPKSRTMSSDLVLKKIDKMKLIPESYKEDADAILGYKARMKKFWSENKAA